MKTDLLKSRSSWFMLHASKSPCEAFKSAINDHVPGESLEYDRWIAEPLRAAGDSGDVKEIDRKTRKGSYGSYHG